MTLKHLCFSNLTWILDVGSLWLQYVSVKSKLGSTPHSSNVDFRPHALRPTFLEIYLCPIYFSRDLVSARALPGRHNGSWSFATIQEDWWRLMIVMMIHAGSRWFMTIHRESNHFIVNPSAHHQSKNSSLIQESLANPRIQRESKNSSRIQKSIVNPNIHR